MQIKHFLLAAASLALPALTAPIPNHDSNILAETGTVNDGHAIIHKRLDPVTDKWICDGDYGDWNGLFRNTFGIPLNCPENEWNTVEDWKPRKKPESYITVNNDN